MGVELPIVQLELEFLQQSADGITQGVQSVSWAVETEPDHPWPLHRWKHPEVGGPQVECLVLGHDRTKGHLQQARAFGLCLAEEVQRDVGIPGRGPTHRPSFLFEAGGDRLHLVHHGWRKRHGNEQPGPGVDRLGRRSLLGNLGAFGTAAALRPRWLLGHAGEYTRESLG